MGLLDALGKVAGEIGGSLLHDLDEGIRRAERQAKQGNDSYDSDKIATAHEFVDRGKEITNQLKSGEWISTLSGCGNDEYEEDTSTDNSIFQERYQKTINDRKILSTRYDEEIANAEDPYSGQFATDFWLIEPHIPFWDIDAYMRKKNWRMVSITIDGTTYPQLEDQNIIPNTNEIQVVYEIGEDYVEHRMDLELQYAIPMNESPSKRNIHHVKLKDYMINKVSFFLHDESGNPLRSLTVPNTKHSILTKDDLLTSFAGENNEFVISDNGSEIAFRKPNTVYKSIACTYNESNLLRRITFEYDVNYGREPLASLEEIAAEQETKSTSNTDIGDLNIEQWNKKWISVGTVDDIDEEKLPEAKGLIKFCDETKLYYLTRAIDSGGIKTKYKKLVGVANTKSLLYRHLQENQDKKIKIEILPVECNDNSVNVCRNLERLFIQTSKIEWR